MAWRGRRCDNLANIKLSQKEHTMTHLEKERERKRKNILGLHSNLRRNIWKYKRELESLPTTLPV